MHQLLQRQIEKFLPPEYLENKEFNEFIHAVNRTYQSFEKEHKITARAFEVSDKENMEANASLQLEIVNREASINNLKEAIHIIKDKQHSIEEEDVLVLSNFVKNELAKRRNAESVFSSIINNLKSGILLENEKQKVLYCNSQFSCLFKLDEEKETLQGNNFIPRLLHISKLFVHPETFLKRVEQIMINKQDISSETLEMKDGRILERSYATIYHNGEFKGHFWNYWDITEKKKAELEIIRQKRFFDEVLNNIPADIAVFDKDHTYLFLNPSAIKNETTREWIIGKTDFDYCTSKGISQEIALKRRKIFEETIQAKKEIQFVDEHPHQLGSKFVLRKFFPHFENNDLKFVIGYGIDITTVKKVELKLEDAMNKLKKTNEELEQFAYVASHDLQEPLRMVSSFLSLLEKKYSKDLDEKAMSYINFAVDGSKRMRQIILDLLEFSRVGRMGDHEMEDLDLNKIVEDVIKLQMQQIMDTGAKINFGVLPQIKNFRIPLTQIIQNLVSNALKYSKEKVSPILDISVKDKGLEWEFAFKDNGIGINPKYFDKIFVIFQRLHNKNTYSGTGIGLSVVKKTIENLGGEIWVESEEGIGTVFFFTLPKNIPSYI
ncbi:MAG: hypothetical protein CFE25_04940 [Chitinophagaceae bacterium BSSC1]|nr:MAG: hypothetical protein CFE25_04940 [Chitinophagaceae bacterium BSSC1]